MGVEIIRRATCDVCHDVADVGEQRVKEFGERVTPIPEGWSWIEVNSAAVGDPVMVERGAWLACRVCGHRVLDVLCNPPEGE